MIKRYSSAKAIIEDIKGGKIQPGEDILLDERFKSEICDHSYRIFNDVSLKGSGYLSFYCQKCLMLVKKKRDYQ